MPINSPTIFILKYRALGDSIMGLSTISYLRSIYPDSKIYYGIRSWTALLYNCVGSDADGIFPIRLESVSDFFKMWGLYRSLKIDHIHELHLSGRTKRFCSAYSALTGTRYTYHNHHVKGGGPVHDQGVTKALIQRDLDGVYSFLGKDHDLPNYLEYPPKMDIEPVEKKKWILFGVVATRATKMWPLSYYVELARRIKQFYPSFQIVVPLSKSEEDQRIQKRLESLDQNRNLTLVCEHLSKLPGLFKSSGLYIGNDTGLKHLAVACGIKTYTFFGPEPPHEWHPYDPEQHPYFYIEALECRTREKHYCGLSVCDSMICMKKSGVADVFEKIRNDFDLKLV